MKKFLPSLLILCFIFSSFGLLAIEMNEEELINGRKALFKQNYGIAKKMSSEINVGNISAVSELAVKMGENYSKLINYFPDNTKTGYDTEALPSVWEKKDIFNELMNEASTDAFKFSEMLANLTNSEIKDLQKKMIWGKCKSCHDQFRLPH